MLAQFNRLSENHKKGQQIGFTDLQPLKTYAWVFGHDEKALVQQWVSDAVGSEMTTSSKSTSKKGSHDDKAIVQVGSLVGGLLGASRVGGSGASSSGVNSGGAAHEKAMARKAEARASVMKFLSPARQNGLVAACLLSGLSSVQPGRSGQLAEMLSHGKHS